MSNHAHVCVTDVRGLLPKFMCQMNSLISRQINALTGETGTNIEKGYSSIEIADDASLLRLSSYTLANPSAANLVKHVAEWKGFCTYDLNYNESIEVRRPECGMWRTHQPQTKADQKTNCMEKRDDSGRKKQALSKHRKKASKLPDVVHAALTRPSIMPELSDKELRELIYSETRQKEKVAAEKRNVKNQKVLGWTRVLRLASNTRPKTHRKPFTRIPLVASHSSKLRIACIEKIMKFRQKYREALRGFLKINKSSFVFPEGTWKMKIQFE